jgi:alkylhydroperoxidase family enzyme
LADDAALEQAAADIETSGRFTAAEKALLRFVDKVNHDSPRIGPADVAELHAEGWSDEAIYDAISVCALFNFYNRWIDASGVHPMSEDAHRAAASRMAPGYLRRATAP